MQEMHEMNNRLATARHLVQAGKLDEAERLYEELLSVAPAEALEFLGVYALRSGRLQHSVEWLEKASGLDPGNLMVLENLGMAYEGLGLIEEASQSFRRVLDRQPEFFVSRLGLGLIERRRGRWAEAVAHVHWAFHQAHKRGFWLDESTTPPWLKDRVLDAAAFANDYRKQNVLNALKDAGYKADDSSLARVAAFVHSGLGIDPQKPPDPRQAPKQHYVPDLPSSPWLAQDLLPWTRRLEEEFPVILGEYLALMRNGERFESFLKLKSPDQVPKYLATTGAPPRWDAFFFYRHGVRNEENCRRCPRTAELLEQLPLIRLPGMAPEICFSILTPGTHILPHRGDANLRSVVHLPLIVPGGCVLKVGGEERTWEPGHVLAFDDTYEHEAWNRSDQIRVVLLMDAWNPHLTDPEKTALTHVIGVMQCQAAEIENHMPVLL